MSKQKNVRETVSGSIQTVYLAGLGAISLVSAEGPRWFDDLVKTGTELQERGRRTLSEKGETMAAKTRRLLEQRLNRVERLLQDRLAIILGRFGVPSKEEIQGLSKRVDDLTRALNRAAKARAVA